MSGVAEFTPRSVMSPQQLDETVARLAGEISTAHPEGVVLVGILKGSAIFLADLARQLTIPCTIEFLALTKYAPDSGRVGVAYDIAGDLSDQAVILVDGVADTGLSLTFLVSHLESHNPASVEICALLDKRSRRIVPVPLTYVGLAVDDEYLIGYGLDHDERYRNLDAVYAAEWAVLKDHRDAYLNAVYHGYS